jgi:hypothetical protein
LCEFSAETCLLLALNLCGDWCEKQLRMRTAVRATWSRRLVLLAIVALAVCACGGGAKPLSEEFSLSPGRYVTDEFEPALSFEVGKGWELSDGLQQKPFFQISREFQEGSYFVAISFNNPPRSVSDPRNPNKLVPAPKDWVSWFQEHPYLETSSPQPMSVGGVEGRRFDMMVSSLPEDYYSEDCLGQGVPLWPLPGGHHWCADEGFMDRYIVLSGVEGETVIIDVWSEPETFEKVLPEAQEVLATVEWEG